MTDQLPSSPITSLLAQCRRTGSAQFWVKIHPNASRSAIKECLDDGTIKIDIAAPPEKGKANRELIAFLAKTFDVPRGFVEIVCGETARQKQIRIFSQS